MFKNINRYFWLLLVILTAFPALNILADGSRNWATPGSNSSSARRAFLRSSMLTSANWPFPNLGTHYVYAKAGERITAASSMQAVGGTARIRLYSPTGTPITLSFTNGGNIANRAQEVAGPRLSGVTSGGGYIPAYYLVPVGGEGVYRVEFISTYTGTNSQTGISASINVTSDWDQSPSTNNTVTIAAWDVSVINTGNTAFIPGRVYTNVLTLSNGSSSPNTTGFYGLVYARTKDGYTYRVNNNGNNGMYFTFFVNNNGFVDPVTQEPIYKSLNYSNPTGTDLLQRVHIPNNADAGTHSTHKLFYTLPATDFPESAPVAVTDNGGITWTAGSTWLNAEPQTPTITNVRLVGADETIDQVSNKGGYIEFDANLEGNFRLEITGSASQASLPSRTLTGHAFAGPNRTYWDGKDGEGNDMPAGEVPLNVVVQLQGAEVHFPFFDMEYNRFGTIIELLDHTNLNDVVSDIVYWNDDEITNSSNGNNEPRGRYSDPKNNSHLPPVNSSGTKSNTNGHIWGIGATGTSGQFGDEKSIDTWTFITGPIETKSIDVTVKIADLEVLVTANKTDINIDNEIEYTAVVKNNGPSDVVDAPFSFALPPGFDPVGTPVFTGSGNCTESIALVYDSETNTYRSKLNMVNGCEVTYTFKAKVTDASDPDNTDAIAGILRPNDVTDLNATNQSDRSKPTFVLPSGITWDTLWKYPAQWPTEDDVNNFYIPPFSAEFECQYCDPNLDCNNVDRVAVDLQRVSDLAIEKTVNNSTPDVGGTITFSLKISNSGPHTATGIIVTDIVPSGFTIGAISNSGTAVGKTITWNIPDLPKGSSTTVSFEATVLSSGSYVNIATVVGDVEDPKPDNNTDTATASPRNNYWMGGKPGAPNDWDEIENWTGGFVPAPQEDIEFATEINNPTVSGDPMSGPAKDDLHLGDGNGEFNRVIGDLINDSDKDIWITTGDQLVINGEVKDNNVDGGTIVVKASPDKPTGTLVFTDPSKNENVGGTVEFYNQAYDCEECGFYTRSWQYFGIPVEKSEFPAGDVDGTETVNQWLEPFNGNKWQPAPYTPDSELEAFKGYQITNDAKTQPTEVYSFSGTLNVGDAKVGVTRTASVNYPGANLIANSYTAAIPINNTSIEFPTGVQQTVYLFNTGTRDQWRKLNGTAINQNGYKRGQYLAVPVNLGGTDHFPDRIPSMHSFMVLAESGTGGDLTIDYSKLVKNTTVALGDGSTQIVTRSATATENNKSASTSTIPSLVMDVIGEESADRVWIFAKEGTTHGFDNGWDGRKMSECGIAQLYVSGADNSQLQVATVPTVENMLLGFEADVDGKYTIEFALSDHWTTEEIYLRDLATGANERVINGGSYTFEAEKGDSGTRFSLSASGIPMNNESAKIVVLAMGEGKIAINNNSNLDCTIFISNTAGKLLQRIEVKAGGGQEVESLPLGSYVVRLQNAVVNDVRKVIVD